ncbi:XrtA/PEP-CTERM system TPR-repeat protein PrsT [Neptunicella marina]|uniref:PEP-CTERM system TPR-repeat protein PrsT n=1 Tax=Neptunicella marina TaxID=2125989 RepID=A0A8J6J1A0_9ALTE|nr:XrtA/PEP-CTERM system TPR-repeat protein PrsT [Neptunicella marina]MBC3767907.1 PEP-CTERM system TPR-repeat protein PrsT [Neptunicella marina]
MNKGLMLSLVLFATSIQSYAIESVNHYEMALRAYSEQKTEEAFIHLKNALQTDPSHLPSKLLLAKVYFDNGLIDAAEKEMEDALKLGADINLVLPILGNSLILQKKVDELLTYEDQYYNLSDEGKFEWHLLRGQAYIIQQDSERAAFEFKEAHQLFPNDSRANNTLATLYIRTDFLEQANTLITQALAANSNDEKAWLLAGELALKQADNQQALKSFEQAHALSPEDPKILRSLTMQYLTMELFDKASITNQQVIKQSPQDPTANLIKAWLLTKDGKQEEAKLVLAEISQHLSLLDPEKMLYERNTTMLQGIAELMQGNLKNSQALLLKHIEQSSGDPNALLLLVKTYIETGEQSKALALLEDKKRTVVKNANLGIILIQLYFQEDNLFRAEQTLQDLKSNFPENPEMELIQARLYLLKDQPEMALNAINSIKVASPNLSHQLLKAKILLKNREPEQAAKISTQLLEQYPDNVDVMNLQAAVLLTSEEFDASKKLLDTILKRAPDNISAIFNQSLIAEHQGDLEQAKKELQKIINKIPNHRQSLLKMSELAVKSGDLKQAKTLINKLLAYFPDNTAAKQKLIALYMMERNWPDALMEISRLIQNDRLNPALLIQQANIYAQMRRFDSASSNYRLVYELWIDSPNQLLQLATQQVKSRDYQGATKSLNKVLELEPDSINAKLALARLALTEGKIKQSEDILASLPANKRQTSDYFELKGDIAIANKTLPKAVTDYLHSIKLNNLQQSAFSKLYLLTVKGIGYQDFIEISENTLNDNPDFYSCRKLLADAYLNHQDWKNAEKHYSQLLNVKQFSHSSVILNNLAYIYSQTDLTKAYKTAMEGLENGGNKNPSLLDTLGWILVKQDKLNDGLNYLRQAYVLDSKNPETRYHLAYTLVKLDRISEAKDHLAIAVKSNRYPEYQDAINLLKQLD